MKKIILALLVLLNISCSTSDDTNDFEPKTITPVLIGKGDLNGSEGIPQQNSVITNDIDWKNLKTQIGTYNVSTLKENTINFNDFQIVVVFDKVYGNGGHSIDITNVIENSNNIKITIEHLLTGGAAAVIPQPYHIIKIPKSTKPIVFQ